jgi:hypothetical protein
MATKLVTYGPLISILVVFWVDISSASSSKFLFSLFSLSLSSSSLYFSFSLSSSSFFIFVILETELRASDIPASYIPRPLD